ncbi:MAG: hypothetical protein HZA49_05140 [Planctomycetes bacterium]|nr:hypothetical protein [Planctomycetota bacterium]
MKNILYGLIIVGFLAAIAGIFLVFTERNKAIDSRMAAEDQKDIALEAKKKADSEKADALKAREASEVQAKQAREQADKAISDSAQAMTRVKSADDEKDKALKEKQEAEKTREEALSAKALAEKAKQDAESKEGEAEARAKAEISAREIADQNLEKEISARKALEDDVYVIREVAESSKKIAVFCSDVVSKIFIPLDSGDKQYLKACESWRDAKDTNQKRSSLAYFSKSKDNYVSALSSVSKMDNVTKETERVKELLKRAIQDSIDSMDTMINLLKRLLQEGDAVPFEDRTKSSDRAIAKKLSADNTIVECCTLILSMMEVHKVAFTPSMKARIEGVKKEIEKRLKPDEESALSPDR